MEQTQTASKSLTVIALALLAVGCASELQDPENLAVSAGFKIITPTQPDQQAILATLPADKVTPITYKGKSYFVLPDVKNNRAYVGGQNEYQAYQQLRHAKQLSNENLEAARMNKDSSNWDKWAGWDMGGPGHFQ